LVLNPCPHTHIARMLQKVVENVLLKYLTPYVENLSVDQLKADLWTGVISLEKLKLKKDLFSMINVEMLQLEYGEIESIKVNIPWSKVLSGQISVSISGVKTTIRTRKSDASSTEVVDELRKGKLKALELSVQNILAKVQEIEEEKSTNPADVGMVAKVVRNVIKNIKIEILDVEFVGKADDMEMSFKLPSFLVSSMDKDLQGKPVLQESKELYKSVEIKDVSMSLLGEAMFTPVSMQMSLVHADKNISLKIEFIGDGGLYLSRKQYVRVLKETNRLEVEKKKIMDVWIPPAAAATLPMDHHSLKTEYCEKYRMKLMAENGINTDPIPQDVLDRLALMDDAVSNFLLRKWQANEMKAIMEISKAIKQRKLEQVKAAQDKARSEATWGQYLWGTSKQNQALAKKTAEDSIMTGMTQEEQDKFFKQLNDESVIESVALPQTGDFTFIVPAINLRLIDGPTITLRLTLQHSELQFIMKEKTDHRGVLSAEWTFKAFLKSLHLLTHSKKPVLHFVDAKKGFMAIVENRLEDTRNLMSLLLQAGHTESNLEYRTFSSVIKFFDKSDLNLEVVNNNPKVQQNFQMEEGIEYARDVYNDNQETIEEIKKKAYERAPDCIEFRIEIWSPEFNVTTPSNDIGKLVLGRLCLETPKPCTYDMLSVYLSLSETSMQAISSSGEMFNVLQPVPIEIKALVINKESFDLDLNVEIESVILNLAPEAALIMMSLPNTLVTIASTDGVPRATEAWGTINAPRLSQLADGNLEDFIGPLDTFASVAQEVEGLQDYSLRHQARQAMADALKRGRKLQAEFKEQRLKCVVKFPLVDITLSNSIVPVINTKLRVPIINVTQHTVGGEADLDVSFEQNFNFVADFFNPRVGAWEPIVEPWDLGLSVNKGSHKLTIDLRTGKPLLINVTPTAISTLMWFGPYFIAAIKGLRNFHVQEVVTEAKFRYLNLTQNKIKLTFFSMDTNVGSFIVSPSEFGESESIDKYILPTLADRLTISTPGDSSGQPSRHLMLHQLGTTKSGNIKACMFAPHPSHKLLVLTYEYGIHNTLEMPLELSFDGETMVDGFLSARREVIGFPEESVIKYRDDSLSIADEDQVQVKKTWIGPNEFTSVDRQFCFIRPKGRVHWSSILGPDSTGVLHIKAELRESPFFCDTEWKKIPSGSPLNEKNEFLLIKPALLFKNTLPMRMSIECKQAGDRVLRTSIEGETTKQLHMFNPNHELSLRAALGGEYRLGETSSGEGAKTIATFIPVDEEERAGEAKATLTGENATLTDQAQSQALGTRSQQSKSLSQKKTRRGDALVRFSLGTTMRAGSIWAVNKSTINLTLLDMNELPLPVSDTGIALLPEKNFKIETSQGVYETEIGGDFETMVCGSRSLCLRTEQFRSLQENARVVYLLPPFVLSNCSDVDVTVQMDDKLILLAPNVSEVYTGVSTTCKFKVGSFNWSDTVSVGGEMAGRWSFILNDNTGRADVWVVEICPEKGLFGINFTQAPAFEFRHQGPKTANVKVNSMLQVAPGESCAIGWQFPMGDGKEKKGTQNKGLVEVVVDGKMYLLSVLKSGDVPATAGYKFKSKSEGQKSVISFEPTKATDVIKSMNIEVSVALGRIGLSVISETFREEFLYIQGDLFRMGFRFDKKADLQSIDCILADCQIDCQLQKRISLESCADGESFFKEQTAGNRAVIFGNAGDSEFLILSLTRSSTVSSDLYLQKVELKLSPLEANIDDEVIKGLEAFAKEAFKQKIDAIDDTGVSISRLAITPFLSTWTPRTVPSVLVLDSLILHQINLSVWISLALKNMNFLPDLIKVILHGITVSGHMTVEGGSLDLDAKKVSFRGPAATLGITLASEYRNSILKSLASILGASSLLNVPRVPLQMGQKIGSFGAKTVGTVFGEASSILGHLTFDEDYVKQQKKLRDAKKIDGIAAGLTEGLKSVAGAGAAVFSVVTEPIKGAKKSGVGGFFSGLARGAVNTVVKPITKIGQAAEDLTTGLAKEIGTEGKIIGSKQTILVKRKRPPRLLFGDMGIVRVWSDFDAWVWKNMQVLCRGIQIALPLGLTDEGTKELTFASLLLFSDSIIMAQINTPKEEEIDDSVNSIFDAIGGASGKVVGRLMVPLRTVAKTGNFVLRPVISLFDDDQQVPEEVTRRVLWSIELRDISSGTIEGNSVVFFDQNQTRYPIYAEALNDKMRRQLLKIATEKHLDTERLGKLLKNDGVSGSGKMDSSKNPPSANCVQEERKIKVFQLQRFNLVSWTAPFLPVEPDAQKVWFDTNMEPHSKLNKKFNLEDLQAADVPPIDAGDLWKPVGPWEIVDEDADELGWTYAVNWQATVWTKEPGWFDIVRRRLWQRRYE